MNDRAVGMSAADFKPETETPPYAWALELDAAEAALADAQLRQFEATREIEKCYSRVSVAMKDRDLWIAQQISAASQKRLEVR